MSRTNSEFSLPDLGSWSLRNSYAEPILNIISDELEPGDIRTTTTKNHDPGTSKSETRAIIEHVDKQKNENYHNCVSPI
jgi:hypothetical protein